VRDNDITAHSYADHAHPADAPDRRARGLVVVGLRPTQDSEVGGRAATTRRAGGRKGREQRGEGAHRGLINSSAGQVISCLSWDVDTCHYWPI
jgi:hypothetical protein